MHSDDEIVDQLRQSFALSTQSLTPAPGLAAKVRRRAQHRRTAQIWATGGSTLTAAGLVVGATALAHNGSGTGSSPSALPSTSSPTTNSTRSSSSPAAIHYVDAAQVLDTAVAQTRTKSSSLSPGQYVHIQTHSYEMSEIVLGHVVVVFTENTSDQWTPATGLSFERDQNNTTVTYLDPADRAYLQAGPPGAVPTPSTAWYAAKPGGQEVPIFPAGNAPTVVQLGGGGATSPWDEPPAQAMATLPRDPVALRASLYRYATAAHAEAAQYGKGDYLSADDAAFQAVSSFLEQPLLPADLRAALYQVANTIPDIKLIGSLANYDGVRGIAIGRVDGAGIEDDLIFDPASGQYLGDRQITTHPTDTYPGTQGQPTLPTGTVMEATAVSTNITARPTLPAAAKLPN